MPTYDLHQPLVSVEWLAPRLNDPDIAVLDATFFLPRQSRDAFAEYRQAHIPGARFFDIDTVADLSEPLPHTLPNPGDFALAAGFLGIDNRTRVVVYDNNAFLASARAWWMFRVFGHDNAAVLDGGLNRWKAGGHPLESGSVDAASRVFNAGFRRDLVFDLQQMRAASRERVWQIVDTRSPGRFSGAKCETEPGMRSGHIPRSLNLHYESLRDGLTLTLLPAERLGALCEKAGINLDEPIVTTCGSGVSAVILALSLYTLNRRNVPVYDGSWAEWSRQKDTTVE
ncbi:MAG: 3-mercaptopyruvate sulfurtransferase [Pseudomonadota bacterium]